MNKKTAAYIILQEAFGIQKGDKVRVLRVADEHEMGWQNSWNPVMTKNVGKILSVIRISTCPEYGIVLDDKYAYPFFVLEIVKKGSEDLANIPDFGCQHDKVVELIIKHLDKRYVRAEEK